MSAKSSVKGIGKRDCPRVMVLCFSESDTATRKIHIGPYQIERLGRPAAGEKCKKVFSGEEPLEHRLEHAADTPGIRPGFPPVRPTGVYFGEFGMESSGLRMSCGLRVNWSWAHWSWAHKKKTTTPPPTRKKGRRVAKLNRGDRI